MPWPCAITEYATSLRAARRSPGTVRLQVHYLHRLAGATASPWGVTTADLRRALDVPLWSAETRKSARSAYVGFYRWGTAEGMIDPDPAERLAAISVPPGKPRPAPERVLEKALMVAGPRERVMLLLAAYAGLRCAEIAAVHHRDLVDGILYVVGKGGKTRVVPVEHPELIAAIARTDGWMFPSPRGGHLTPGCVTKLLSGILPGHWTGHTLRHRFATRSYAANADVFALGQVLGHSRPETTMRYVLLPPEALWRVVRGAA
ncbi:MAG: tyrosine-type recombinase/integrase [Actinomycetales bacterium]|nr:tyrosine-type recombinase/integrase [Actinomycetales bacterium]